MTAKNKKSEKWVDIESGDIQLNFWGKSAADGRLGLLSARLERIGERAERLAQFVAEEVACNIGKDSAEHLNGLIARLPRRLVDA